MWRLPLLLAVLLLPAGAGFAQMDEAPIVREIEIKRVGPIPVSDAVVKANIRTEVGKTISRNVLDDDVRALYKTGNFLNIRVTQELLPDGAKVIFTIQGKATVKDVQITGTKKVPLARVQRQIKVKVGDVLDERKIEEDKNKLTEYYQDLGYEHVVVRRDIKVDEDTGKASITYAIEEGSRVFIQKVEFVGNKAFSAKRLQRQIKTKKRWFFSFISKSGVLKPDRLEEDLDNLRAFYRDEGYIDVEIPKPEYLHPSPQWLVIRIQIHEGIQYKVGTVQVRGNQVFPTADLLATLKMTEGKTFTPPGLTKDIEALRDYYGARGYIDAVVRPIRSANVDTGRMDITYDIVENQLCYVEFINVTGNTKTKDKVIRRELAVAPGEVFDMVKVKRSRERLQNLGYFSKVETSVQSTDVPSRKNLDLQVEEQKTGDLSFGAGFSSIDALVFFAEIKQGNFDLFNPPTFTGGGQKLRLRTQLGTERLDFIISFTEPWFLDQRLNLGVDAYYSEASYLSDLYDEGRIGADIKLGRPLTAFTKGEIIWKHEIVDIFNVSKPQPKPGGNYDDLQKEYNQSAPQVVQDAKGMTSIDTIGVVLDRDTRDNVFLSKKGNRAVLNAELANPLGDEEFWKVDFRFNHYFSFFDRSHVLLLLFATGTAQEYGNSDDIPFFEKFYLGGGNNLRGFAYRDVGPKVGHDPKPLVPPTKPKLGVGEPIGGKTYAWSTAEYSVPVITRVRFAVFFDIGQVWEDTFDYELGDLNSDAGLGLRLDLPIGPIRLDYAFPIQTDSFNDGAGRFNFNVGYQF
jgi:outer membrane protein insertion porin family